MKVYELAWLRKKLGRVKREDPEEALRRRYFERRDLTRALVQELGPWESVRYLAEVLEEYVDEVAENRILVAVEDLRLVQWRFRQEAFPEEDVFVTLREAAKRIEVYLDENPYASGSKLDLHPPS
jgi:hypothetical protein